MPKNAEQDQATVDHNKDRFPSVRKALHVIAAEAETIDGQPEHLEIHFMQSGECTWRMWLKGADETVGNVIPDVG